MNFSEYPVNIIPIGIFPIEVANVSAKLLYQFANSGVSDKSLMSSITIRIERKDQEFDGLFFSKKEIILKNNFGDSLKIPPESPIIIEVKNITNYSTIVNNIRTKKKKLNSLKLNESNFYFIGIIRNIDINE